MDPDTLLMPPPPPRFSKRQRVHSPNVGRRPPPLSISFPNRRAASPGGHGARAGAGGASDDDGGDGGGASAAAGSPPKNGAAKQPAAPLSAACPAGDFPAKDERRGDGKENRPDVDVGGRPPGTGGSPRTADGIEDEEEEDGGRRGPDPLADLDANGPPGQVSSASSADNGNSLRDEGADGDDGVEDDADGADGSGGAPSVSFADIIGHGHAKLRLEEALLPLALPPELAATVLTGIRAAPASILLHGPPGCGKTKLARAVAGEAQAAFLSVGPSDILSKFVGESEASIRGLFREARRRARGMESKCAVVFFDEVDALGQSRVDEESGKSTQAGGDNSSRRVLAELLIQMTELSNNDQEDDDDDDDDDEKECGEGEGGYEDGDSLAGRSTLSTGASGGRHRREDDYPAATTVSQPSQGRQQKPRIIVVAATNRPEDCDPALLRRFAVRVLVGLPSRRDRRRIVRRLLSGVESDVTPAQLDELALATAGWSGSDLESMTREAVMAPVRECLRRAAVERRRATGYAGHAAVRESLLGGFRSLRPVSARDFEGAIAFFLGEGQGNPAVMSPFGGGRAPGRDGRRAHYDSSSSSEDEGGEDDEEEESNCQIDEGAVVARRKGSIEVAGCTAM